MTIPNEDRHGEPTASDGKTTWFLDECCTLPGPDIGDLVEAVSAYGSTTVGCLMGCQQAPGAFTGRELAGRGEGGARNA